MLPARILCPFLLLFSSLVFGAEGTKAAHEVTTQGAYLAQVFIGLLLVLAMIIGMGWLLKRLGQGALVNAGQLQVVASLSLGAREKVALIQVADRQLLIGITPNNIRTLQTFDEPVVSAGSTAGGTDFASRLMSAMNRDQKQGSDHE